MASIYAQRIIYPIRDTEEECHCHLFDLRVDISKCPVHGWENI